MMEDQRKKVVMEKLKKSFLLRHAAMNPSSSSIINSPNVSSFLDNHLPQIFKDFHTPDHPPYHSMINTAMEELNDKSGSTEEEISKFIRREYEDLPIAHRAILQLHLRKLYMNGELVCIDNGRYVLVDRMEKETVQPKNNLPFQVLPKRIVDWKTKNLRGKKIHTVKVIWEDESTTWELEGKMKHLYPYLFSLE